MFLVSWCNKTMDLALQLYLFVIAVRVVPFGQTGLASVREVLVGRQ